MLVRMAEHVSYFCCFSWIHLLRWLATLAEVVACAKLAKQTVTITNVMRVALILTFSMDEGCLFKNYG